VFLVDSASSKCACELPYNFVSFSSDRIFLLLIVIFRFILRVVGVLSPFRIVVVHFWYFLRVVVLVSPCRIISFFSLVIEYFNC
jgi:hypothetical protein